MILRCLVVTITRNRKGQPIRNTRLASGDPITIGRSAESTVYLPDPRVHLKHALIRNNDLGKLYVEGHEAAVDVNGELHSRTKLRRGARILIGPYQITPEPPTGDDHDFGLAIEMVQPLAEDTGELTQRAPTLLSQTWLPKRGLAWLLFLVVAGLSLALPLAYARSLPNGEVSASPLPGPLSGVAWNVGWDAGPLSAGHRALSQRCDACHQVGFEPVQDQACLKCHTTAGEHGRLASFHEGHSLSARCAECHRDHRGEGSLVRSDPTLCVSCHGDIKARYPQSSLVAISDFATDHPAFSASMVNGRTGEIERIPLANGTSKAEDSGLKFPHATHLAAAGVRSPDGIRVLHCADCHTLDSAQVRFVPVSMEAQCSQCHRLEFEPAVTTRRAPHGTPEQVMTTLREFYSMIAIGQRSLDVTLVNEKLRRPTAEEDVVRSRKARTWADRKALAIGTELMETRLCVQCHQISRVDDEADGPARMGEFPRWEVRPIRTTAHWLPGSRFDHKSHAQAACEKCHDVRSSRTSADIAIPDIGTCQTCHSGAVAVQGKVRSTCETCHSFHQRPRAVEAVLATSSDEPVPNQDASKLSGPPETR